MPPENDAPTFLIFRPDFRKYCTGAPNSVGDGAVITATGFGSLAADEFGLRSQGLPPGEHGVFFYGPGPLNAVLGDGFLCVSGPHYRLPVASVDAAGLAGVDVDFSNLPNGGDILPGSTWSFQFWYRDPAGPGGSGSNTSDALEATFGS